MKFKYSPFTNKISLQEQRWPRGVGLNTRTADSLIKWAANKNISPEHEEHLARGLVRGGFGNLTVMSHGGPDLTQDKFETTPQEHNVAARVLGWFRKRREATQRTGATTNTSKMLPAPPQSEQQTPSDSAPQSEQQTPSDSAPPEQPPSAEEMAAARTHWSRQRQIGRQVRKGLDAAFQGMLQNTSRRRQTGTPTRAALPEPNPRMQELASRIAKRPLLAGPR
jgi:hypothetical protein